MANGVNGSPRPCAAQRVVLGLRSWGGSVTVPRLDQGARTALALGQRQKDATLSNVQVGTKCVCRVLTN